MSALPALPAVPAGLLWLVLLLPAVVGALLATVGPLGGARAGAVADRAAVPLGITTAAVVTALSLVAAVAGSAVSVPFVAGADLGLDAGGLATLVGPPIGVVGLCALAVASTRPETTTARFGGLMLLFVASAELTVLATSLPALLLGWELMGAASYALIGYRWREPRVVGSGSTAFLTTRAADLGLYVATGAALAGGAGLALDDLADASTGWRHVVAAGVLVAALGKAAQLPFSFWLSRAMDGPAPVSALLHSAAMVALGGYLLLRVGSLLDATGWAATTAAWTGALTALLLGAVAVVQRDLKQLLAASTAAQLGFVVLAAGVGATTAGAGHLVAHAAVKALLFLAAGAWLHALGTKQLAGLTGVARRWPAVGLLAVVGLLTLAGLPPLALWWTKDSVLGAVLEVSPPLYAVGLAASVLSAVYAGRALGVVVAGPPAASLPDRALREEPATFEVPDRVVAVLRPLAVGCLMLGLLVVVPWAGVVPEATQPGVREALVSGVLAVLALAGAVLVELASPGHVPAAVPGRLLHDWLGLERAAHAVVVRPALALADRLAHLDDRVLGPAVDRVGPLGLRLARVVRTLDAAALERGVSGVATGARQLGRTSRRPSSTGQLHDYFLQTVLGLGLALVVVLAVLLLDPSVR